MPEQTRFCWEPLPSLAEQRRVQGGTLLNSGTDAAGSMQWRWFGKAETRRCKAYTDVRFSTAEGMGGAREARSEVSGERTEEWSREAEPRKARFLRC